MSNHEADSITTIERLVAHARAYADSQQNKDHIEVRPALGVALVACMDSRIDLFGLLGLEIGDAHVIRNAGGVVTDDVIRSIVVSQRVLGTRTVVLVHHTDCGLQKITDDGFKDQLEQELGIRPQWSLEAFRDPFADVKQSIARLKTSPYLVEKSSIYGFVYDVDTRELIPVIPS